MRKKPNYILLLFIVFASMLMITNDITADDAETLKIDHKDQIFDDSTSNDNYSTLACETGPACDDGS